MGPSGSEVKRGWCVGAAAVVGGEAARQTQLAVTNKSRIRITTRLWETQRKEKCVSEGEEGGGVDGEVDGELTRGTGWRREALSLLAVVWYVRHVLTPGGFSDCLCPFHCLGFVLEMSMLDGWNQTLHYLFQSQMLLELQATNWSLWRHTSTKWYHIISR